MICTFDFLGCTFQVQACTFLLKRGFFCIAIFKKSLKRPAQKPVKPLSLQKLHIGKNNNSYRKGQKLVKLQKHKLFFLFLICKANVLSGKANVLSGKANVLSGKANVLSGKANVLSGKANVLSGKANYLTTLEYCF